VLYDNYSKPCGFFGTIWQSYKHFRKGERLAGRIVIETSDYTDRIYKSRITRSLLNYSISVGRQKRKKEYKKNNIGTENDRENLLA
jgi:hypothetical protein